VARHDATHWDDESKNILHLHTGDLLVLLSSSYCQAHTCGMSKPGQYQTLTLHDSSVQFILFNSFQRKSERKASLKDKSWALLETDCDWWTGSEGEAADKWSCDEEAPPSEVRSLVVLVRGTNRSLRSSERRPGWPESSLVRQAMLLKSAGPVQSNVSVPILNCILWATASVRRASVVKERRIHHILVEQGKYLSIAQTARPIPPTVFEDPAMGNLVAMS